MKNRGLVSLVLACGLSQQGLAKGTDRTVYEPLTQRELITLLREYDVSKATIPPVGNPFLGVTLIKGVTDFNAKHITLNRIVPGDHMDLTILHEFRHAVHARKGYSQDEKVIRDYSCRDYESFFGKSCPSHSSIEEAVKPEYLR